MFFSKNVNMDKKCPICNRHLLSHSRTMQCAVCHYTCQVKCISLDNNERSNIWRDANSWYCSLCLVSVFPFNHIEDGSDLSKAICTKDNLKLSELHFSDKIFNPMEILDREVNNLLDDSDPDLHFYNEIYQKSIHKCNYLTESSFKDHISLSKSGLSASLSLCHINIRSLNRNLDDFIMFIESLEFEFSVLGFSETWLRDDNCDLYGIPGFSICEKHRKNAVGGGVAIYARSDIAYTERNDISYFDECMESVFIEIPKDVFKMDKNIIVGTVYRPPGTNKFYNRMEEVIIHIQKENKSAILWVIIILISWTMICTLLRQNLLIWCMQIPVFP